MRARGSKGCVAALVAVAVLIVASAAFGQGEVITEVTVIYGGSSGIQPPAGFTKIPVDLNRNASGDYIFACYKKGVGAPITGLYVTYGAPPSGDEHCTMIDVDLNRNAGGAYLYLWYTKDPNCSAVADMTVIIGHDTAPPPGYTKIPVDLNEGAGGDFIYLCYRMK